MGEVNGTDTQYGLFYRAAGTPYVNNAYYLEGIEGSNVPGQTGTSLTAAYMSSTAFVNELNQNKRAIDLTTEYDGVLADYELSDWKYDSTKGYPILDN